MRRGEIGVMMWLALGLMVLIAIILVVMSMKEKSFGIIDTIREALS
jgi:heme exporter protein D